MTTAITCDSSASRRWLPTILRVLFGLAWTTFGANGLLDFLPHPTTMPPAGAMAFGGALFQTGYMLPLIAGTELAAGLLLLSGRLAPLGVVVLAPVLVNIIAFHAFLDPSTILIPSILLVIELYLAWTYRRVYRGLVIARPVELW